jgi:hypothetical protein
MFVRRLIFLVITVVLPVLLAAQNATRTPKRDAPAIEILTRTVISAGGLHPLSAVRDMTESGEITVYWGENVKGPVIIRTQGASRFRMEADLPQGKLTWIVKDGVGSKKESDKITPLSRENAINLGNLTYPVGHLAAALADPGTEVTFVGIEKKKGRSVYRLRLKGKLGLVSNRLPASVVKDVIVDALSFDILSIEDHPYPTCKIGGTPTDTAPREIEYTDFRMVDGVKVPFSIDTKFHGQRTLSVSVNDVTFNTHVPAEDFQLPK